MNSLLKRPQTNAICIGVFSAFYAVLFFVTAGHIEFENILYFIKLERMTASFWTRWSAFLAAGHHRFVAFTLVAVTLCIIWLLLTRRKSYDEYHMSRLISCLIVALVLTLIAIAIFFLVVLSEPVGIVEKFMFFIVVHWATVVFADLVYVLLCK